LCEECFVGRRTIVVAAVAVRKITLLLELVREDIDDVAGKVDSILDLLILWADLLPSPSCDVLQSLLLSLQLLRTHRMLWQEGLVSLAVGAIAVSGLVVRIVRV
jgi:hypothetical protein